jgi:hypothetical protein
MQMRRNVKALLSLSHVKLLNREDDTMTSTDATHHIPADVRAAIHAFLDACQKEATVCNVGSAGWGATRFS